MNKHLKYIGCSMALGLSLVGCGVSSVPDVTPRPAQNTPMPTVKPDDSYEADDHGHVVSPEGDNILDIVGDGIEDVKDATEEAIDSLDRDMHDDLHENPYHPDAFDETGYDDDMGMLPEDGMDQRPAL